MKQKIVRLILSIPYPLLKKSLYLYVGAIALWNWSPVSSLALLLIILTSLLLIYLQASLWISDILRKHSTNGIHYIEKLRASPVFWIPKLLFVIVVSMAFGYFWNGFLGLNSVQLFLLPVGYILLYRETVLLGNYTVYIITDQGIGIQFIPTHYNYRTFIRFEDIHDILVCHCEQYPQQMREALCLAPNFEAEKGLILKPFHPRAFSNQNDTIFISPRKLDRFIAQLPGHLIRKTETFI